MICNFKYKEIIKSETAQICGIDNSVPLELYDNMLKTVVAMQKIRELLGVPIIVTSWYRCPKLNEKVGGSKTSSHMKCLAVDFKTKLDKKIVIEKIKNSDIEFDQLILEKTWIHIGFGERMRREVFEL